MSRIQQFLFASALVVVILVSLMARGWVGARQIVEDSTAAQTHVMPGLRYLEQMRFGILRIVSSTSELLVVNLTGRAENAETPPGPGEEVEVGLIEQGEQAFRAAFDPFALIYRRHHAEHAHLQSPETIHRAFENLVAEARKIMRMVETGAGRARLGLAKKRFEQAEMTALGTISSLLEQAQREAGARLQHMSAAAIAQRNETWMLGVAAILVVLVYSVFVTRLAREEHRARHAAEALAREQEREVERRRRLESRLASQQKLEALGGMLGGIAHSVNNFLTPIITLGKMLKNDLPRETQQHEDAAQIVQSAQNAASVIRDVLAFSRNREERPDDTCDLQACLARALHIAAVALPSDVRLVRRMGDGQFLVPLREADLQTIVLNLVTNALHAMRGHSGTIEAGLDTLDLTPELAASLGVTSRPGRYARFWISDEGAGIPEDVLPKIFDPFFTTKDVGEGAGLGLSVTYTAVSRAGGDITVDSWHGQGSRFDVFLPLLEEAETDQRGADALPARERRSA